MLCERVLMRVYSGAVSACPSSFSADVDKGVPDGGGVIAMVGVVRVYFAVGRSSRFRDSRRLPSPSKVLWHPWRRSLAGILAAHHTGGQTAALGAASRSVRLKPHPRRAFKQSQRLPGE